jgi:hypothetical protein
MRNRFNTERARPARESRSAGVPPAIHERSEKPPERGLRFAAGPKPQPGVNRRAEDRLRRKMPVNRRRRTTFF